MLSTLLNWEKLVVLEALVVRLREVIEEDAHFRQSAGLKPEEEKEEKRRRLIGVTIVNGDGRQKPARELSKDPDGISTMQADLQAGLAAMLGREA